MTFSNHIQDEDREHLYAYGRAVEAAAADPPFSEVAPTILKQLGGHKFVAMTGARDFVADDDSLMFRLPKQAKEGINKVVIQLLPDDTYAVRFYRLGPRAGIELITDRMGVYADSLQSVFSAVTGLDTHLLQVEAAKEAQHKRLVKAAKAALLAMRAKRNTGWVTDAYHELRDALQEEEKA